MKFSHIVLIISYCLFSGCVITLPMYQITTQLTHTITMNPAAITVDPLTDYQSFIIILVKYH